MRQLVITFFSIVLMVGNVQATESTNSHLRCSTNYNNGNFSIFVGNITKNELRGYLTRGLNNDFGKIHETFEISAEIISISDNGIYLFQLNSDLFLPAPLDFIGWEKSIFSVNQFLLSTHKGRMVEVGNFLETNHEIPYRNEYKCVAL